jgi:hypothetical protein
MSSRVFVVQNQHKWDRDRQKFVPKFDLSPAEEFGELVFLLSPTAAPFRPDPIIQELRTKLAVITPEDYILCVGNPLLIQWAGAIAADFLGGRLRSLQWSGKDQRYIAVEVDGLFTS